MRIAKILLLPIIVIACILFQLTTCLLQVFNRAQRATNTTTAHNDRVLGSARYTGHTQGHTQVTGRQIVDSPTLRLRWNNECVYRFVHECIFGRCFSLTLVGDEARAILFVYQ